MKRTIIAAVCLSLCFAMTGCTLKTDSLMSELKEMGYVQEYEDGEKVVKYDGVVPSKQVYYEYDIKNSEANQRYRIYFDETDESSFTLYDYENGIWYRFEQNGGELTETERYKFR